MALKIKSILSKVIKTDHSEDEAPVIVDQSTSVEQKIKAIMVSVFKIDISEINEETSSDNVPQWTSLEHVDFVLNLQKQFDIEFTDSQIVEELLSYKTAVQTVEAALQEKNHR
jgi:acyl carrier protein